MRKLDIYQTITLALSIAIVISIGVFVYNLFIGGFGKAGISVDVQNGVANVIINGKDKGQTPVYTEELNAKNINVQINGEATSYSTIVKPSVGTMAAIKRELGVGGPFSSGLNLWFAKVSGEEKTISVISPDVEEVSVVVDGVEVGKTPVKFSTKDLLKESENNRYVISFQKDNYQSQEIEIEVKPGYELNIRSDMFLKPLGSDIKVIQGFGEGIRFLGFENITDSAFSDRKLWAKALVYWLSSRGAIMFDNNRIEVFNYFISDDGKVYNNEANEIAIEDMSPASGDVILYLGSADNSVISDEAKLSIEKITGQAVVTGSSSKIKILPTGIGYLKVRSGPSTGNSQIGQVNEGLTFDVVETQGGWYKIYYESDKVGWVSGTYAEIVN